MSLRASEEFNYTVYDPQKVTIHMDVSVNCILSVSYDAVAMTHQFKF